MLNIYVVDRSQYSNISIESERLKISEGDRTGEFKYKSGDRVADFLILKRVLSMVLGLSDCVEIEIERGQFGKPFITGPIKFNVSHSESFLVIAVSSDEVGVDVEEYNDSIDVMKLARRFFTVDEVEWLSNFRGFYRTRMFTELWSLKESHLKRLGTGLPGGLDRLRLIRKDGWFSLYTDDPLGNYYSLMLMGHNLSVASECLEFPQLYCVELVQNEVGFQAIYSEGNLPWARHMVY